MTLRARLTATLLGVAVAPVLVGGVVVTFAAGSMDRSRDAARLDVAATALRTSVTATCDRLRAAASSVAASVSASGGGTASTSSTALASAIVSAGRASGVAVVTTSGAGTFTTIGTPVEPWAWCTPVPGTSAPALAGANSSAPVALAAGATVRGPSGTTTGYAYAVEALDSGYVTALAADIGATVTLGPDSTRSTDPYVRRIVPFAGQPVEFTVSVPATTRSGLIPSVAGLAALAAALALFAARRIGRRTEHVPEPVDLDVLGDTLSSTHDLPRILRVILDSAIAATAATKGVVLLVNGNGALEVQCSHGVDSVGIDPTSHWEPAVGVWRSVATTGVARRGRVSGPSANGASGNGRATQHGTFLAVPMQLPSPDGAIAHPDAAPDAAVATVRGVIALYDRAGGADFDDGDLQTVRTFAGHAAVAVDNVRLHDEARRLSHTDPLTGLYNFRHLQDTLGREINRSQRFGHPLCVMALDLDLFKHVNDTYGHGAGDAVLVEFARRVGSVIRGVDLAFRAGGEEFVLLLPETGAPGGSALAQRLGAVLRDTPMIVPDVLRATANLATMELPLVRLAGHDAWPADGSTGTGRVTSSVSGGPPAVAPRHMARISITVSIGVAVFPDHGATARHLLEAADLALYAAKSAGRDTYRVAEPRPAAGPGDADAAATPDRAAAAGTVDTAVGAGDGSDTFVVDRPDAAAGDPVPERNRPDQGAEPLGAAEPASVRTRVSGGESTSGPPPQRARGR
ncbi:MAG TPA: diguanylate cyclase [Micromonosporaceae bacterium]|nr:diguanylate cyclase [Micromonosporaceae bacterium]